MTAMACRVLLCVFSLLAIAKGVDYCSSQWNPIESAVIDTKPINDVSTLRGIVLYFCEERDIYVQVWRRLSDVSYYLERQYLVEGPGQAPNTVILNIQENFQITSEHRLGIYMPENRNIPVSTEFIDASGTQIVSDASAISFLERNSYDFINLPYPYVFQVEGCREEDCSDRNYPPPRDATAPPPVKVECKDGDLVGVENRAVIQENVIYPSMTVRGVMTYFCTDNDVTLQVWEPRGGDTYRLINAIPLIKPVGAEPGDKSLIQLEDRYIFDITPAHRIGFHEDIPNQAIPISTVYDDSVAAVIVNAEPEGPYQQQQTYQFDDLRFPYTFRVTLCEESDCVKRVPTTTTTTTAAPSNATSSTSRVVTGSSTSFSPVTGDSASSVTGYTTEITIIPGPQGSKGQKGQRGMTGLKGQQGDAGIKGTPNFVNGVKGYKGDLGVAPQGQRGQKGEAGSHSQPGSRGDKGNDGDRGPPGLSGSKGPTGEPGFLDLLRPDAQTDNSCDCDGLMDKKVVLGLLIWAVLLTIVTVALIVLATRSS